LLREKDLAEERKVEQKQLALRSRFGEEGCESVSKNSLRSPRNQRLKICLPGVAKGEVGC
jgi:hypothetical protein